MSQEKLINTKVECVYIWVKVINWPVITIVNTGTINVIVSIKLARAMKIAPDVAYDYTFGTAGLLTT